MVFGTRKVKDYFGIWDLRVLIGLFLGTKLLGGKENFWKKGRDLQRGDFKG